MSGGRNPHHKRTRIEQAFYLSTRVVLDYPVATVALAVALSIAALLYSNAYIGYRTSRSDLVDPDNEYARLWREYTNEFGAEDDAVVVVEGAGREQVVPVLREISAMLAREDKLFHGVLHGVDLSKIQAKGLHYLSPQELQGIESFVGEVEPIYGGEWTRLNVGRMAAGLALRLEQEQQQLGTAQPPPSALELERLAGGLVSMLSSPGEYRSPWPAMPASFSTLSELNSEYLLMRDGQLGMVLLRMAPSEANFEGNSVGVDALRDLTGRVAARHPEVKIGVTGLPVMENDEMRTSNRSLVYASALSFVGVGLLIVAGFGGLRHAILANLVLLAGMAWSFGWVTLSVGHLNIYSVTFAVSLIGIGIDYGIHFIARYFEVREHTDSPRDALLTTATGVSPAITTGAITTAVAFFAAGFTDFLGVAELGIIAGGGLLLCAVSQLYVLPAAICLVDRLPWTSSIPKPLPVHTWLKPFVRMPRLTAITTLAATALVGLGLGRLWYDHNLLNMQPRGLESVELEQRILSACNQSLWYALSIADSREELLARKAEFLKLDSVERIEEIVSLLPPDEEVKKPIIGRINERLASLPERPPLIDVSPPEQLGLALARAQELVSRSPSGAPCAQYLAQARDLLRRLPAERCYELLSTFQQHMAGDLLSRLHVLGQMSSPEPPQLTDLPESLVDRFVGQHGRHLLKIYGKGSIWEMEHLERFVHDVRKVDPRVTGNPLQAYEGTFQMKSSYEEASIYAAVIIIAVLFLDFRSIRFAALAALPLGLGMVQMFGLMGTLNIPLNPANMIALPLILGLGVDYGVHIVHDFLDQKGPYRMAPSTAVAVLVDSLTTIVGYGAMMIAAHQGMQSLGRILTIGVACCTFSALVILPALLTIFTSGRAEVSNDGLRGRELPHDEEPQFFWQDPPNEPVIPTRKAGRLPSTAPRESAA
ncbi:MAG: MMPL family transporter [Pirellulales bacterium]|nr:MMPL family transporter [Pirellulales bacterium]